MIVRMAEKKETFLLAILSVLLLLLTGCSDEAPQVSDTMITQADREAYSAGENDPADIQRIEEILRDLYEEAAGTSMSGSLDLMRRMVDRLGENGYVAVDSGNQVDMTHAKQALAFCKAVEDKEPAELTVIVILEMGIRKFDLQTEDGSVDITRGYYQYDRNGHLQSRSTVSYPADFWQYTEEGYLIFAGNYFSDESYVLTLSDMPEHTMLRILPLEETCREYNRKYILPVGYGRNNLFLCDWSENDPGDLDFYDLFDKCYPMLFGQSVPYRADEDLRVGAVYQIPGELFENVIGTHFRMDSEALRARTAYCQETDAYEYRPRGFYEGDYSEIAYPEVVRYTENADGTITLYVNAVYPHENKVKEFSHITVIRPLGEDGFQYVSNEVILPEEAYEIWWHSDRLTEEEWEEIYGGDGSSGETREEVCEGNGSSGETESGTESGAKAALWFLPQAAHCLITEAEKEELEHRALTAAKQVREVYQEIEITEEFSYGSRIKEFTKEQCREVVSLLGRAGYVSVAEDTNMENYEEIEDFYAAYRENRDAMVTIFDVNRDGLLGAITFLYRDRKLQTYYVGIDWQKGGVPEVKSTLVSEVAEIRLTEKGYFIYAYEVVIPHSSLRRYFRIRPLSDECRELTAKYVRGLSYVNYNVLVTNWNSDNVEDILMPCMFEDIYRIYTGENLRTENGRIPAETYEKIMTTYFPVSVEALREKCGYDEDSSSYAYEMIFERQYPPFGEVVDYTENPDGTITLVVDGVWADYNSDLAFTNTIVVQPFPDGTFRYLSNAIEQKELEVPQV